MTIFRPDEETKVRELFDALERPVELLVALGPPARPQAARSAGRASAAPPPALPAQETPLAGARDMDFAGETVRIARELALLSERVSCRVEEEPPGFERYPSVAVLPEGEDVGIRYYGLPWGYELGSLVGAVLEAGRRDPSLSAESVERLARLDRDLALDVFVTPT
jgi:hypothetical protein